jgi:hypothetical protein
MEFVTLMNVSDVVNVICDRYGLENCDVLAFVKATLACSPNTNIKPEMKRMIPLKDCNGFLYDPLTCKLYSEIAVE